ncbi:MAG: sulfatase-like hydrolase/transferase [Pseudomonadota bacterium]
MLPIHPVLLASFLWLSSYAANRDELFFHDVMGAGLAITGAAMLLVGLVWSLTRNAGLSGVLALIIIIGVAYYGRVFDGLDAALGGTLPNGVFLVLWCLLFLAAIGVIAAKRSRFESLTRSLNLVSLALIALPLGSLAIGAVGGQKIAEAQAAPLPPVSVAEGPTRRPDIFYLVFDRYADNRTLKQLYGFDNGVFLEGLRQRGFHVTDQARANYTKTAHSLASSLNLQHLHGLSEQIGSGSGDWKPVYSLLRENRAAQFLKAQGYRYLHLGSWWQPTRDNDLADESFDGTPPLPWLGISLNEFQWLLAKPSLLVRAADLLLGQSHDREREQHQRVRKKFEKLAAARHQDAPLFVFAHMLVPHPPYVFHPDGRFKTAAEAQALPERRNYLDQLLYSNQQIEALLDELLARDPQPIIILQADEGPFPARYSRDTEGFDWRQASDEELKEKFGILNAVYFPDRDYRGLQGDVTPVNTFRVLLNTYFGTQLPLLPDRSYSFASDSDLYSFFDVTDALQ